MKMPEKKEVVVFGDDENNSLHIYYQVQHEELVKKAVRNLLDDKGTIIFREGVFRGDKLIYIELSYLIQVRTMVLWLNQKLREIILGDKNNDNHI